MGLLLEFIRPYRRLSGISLLALSLALLALNCADTQRKVRLQMKFQQGRELVYEQVNKQTISIRNSPTVSQASQSKGEMTQIVKSLSPEGVARIEETSTWSWSEQAEDSSR